MDFDITWRKPTAPQMAAWELAAKVMRLSKDEAAWQREHLHLSVLLLAEGRAAAVDAEQYGAHALREMDAFTLAEMILLADKSLWYTQAKMWAAGETPFGKELTPVFQLAGNTVVRTVDGGYQDGQWWDMARIWGGEYSRLALGLAAVVDAIRIHDQYNRSSPFDLALEDGIPILSTGFRWFAKIVLPGISLDWAFKMLAGDETCAAALVSRIWAVYDPEHRRTHNQMVNTGRKAIRESYEPTKCICPECQNMVAPNRIVPRDGHYHNYRGLGACCQEHAHYQCPKCDTIHSYTTKVGQAHLQYREVV